MNLLFWNLNGNAVGEYVKECLLENEVDIAVFAEHGGVDFRALCRETDGLYSFAEGVREKPRIASIAKTGTELTVRQEQSCYTLHTLKYHGIDFILAGVHLQDRRNTGSVTRLLTIRKLIDDVENMVETFHTKRIIVTGDMNANPYDPELLHIQGFNAALFRDVIQNGAYRTWKKQRYRRLYNPVLHFLSEETKNYGSYYYIGDESPVWHCLDQTLVSASLADSITDFRYLRSIGGKTLISDVRPNKRISDHLPLLVRLDL